MNKKKKGLTFGMQILGFGIILFLCGITMKLALSPRVFLLVGGCISAFLGVKGVNCENLDEFIEMFKKKEKMPEGEAVSEREPGHNVSPPGTPEEDKRKEGYG